MEVGDLPLGCLQSHWRVRIHHCETISIYVFPHPFNARKSLSCVQLFGTPKERVAFPSSRGSSQPRDQTQVSRIAGRFFTSWATREAQKWQEYTEELCKKALHDPDNHDAVITNLEPEILECKFKWALGSITRNKASRVMESQLSYFKS